MDVALFGIALTIYIVVIALLAFEEICMLKTCPTIANKIYISTCAILYIYCVICLTASIGKDADIVLQGVSGNITLGVLIGGVIVYGFIWFFFTCLLGSILLLAFQFFYYLALPKNMKMGSAGGEYALTDELKPTFYCAGASIAYNLILYAFGLIDFFLPFTILG